MGIAVHFTDAGKRFNREWIFRRFNYRFEPGLTYAITGPNGSGKSTLLQTIAGSMEVNEGKCQHYLNAGATPLEAEAVYRHITIAAPYLEVIEEMTALEFLQFHSNFKPFLSGITPAQIVKLSELEKAANKQIRYYSSGMKQRIKLAQAIFSDSPLLLLDEPCTNLDKSGYALYHHLVENYTSGKTIIVSSNDPEEYSFCQHHLSILDYK